MARQPGTPNKDTQELIDMAHKMGCSPFKILCHIAMGDWKALGYKEEKTNILTKSGAIYAERISLDHRLQAASQAAQYLYPKRRAVEVRSISEDTESKLVINFGGRVDPSHSSKVDSGKPVPPSDQGADESAGSSTESLPLQTLVSDDGGGAQQEPDAGDPRGTSGEN